MVHDIVDNKKLFYIVLIIMMLLTGGDDVKCEVKHLSRLWK